MTDEQKAAHLRALKAVHAKMQNWQDQAPYGICTHYQLELERDGATAEEIDNLSGLLTEEFGKWPKFSGSSDLPVPSPGSVYRDVREACLAYHSRESYAIQRAAERWDRQNSPYAALRWELLEWLIARAEADQ